MFKSAWVVNLLFLFPMLMVSKVAGAEEGHFKIISPVLKEGGKIPRKYTCQGSDINPPLEVQNIPAETKSLTLIVDDPDAPMGTWVHWVVYDISPPGKNLSISENSVPGNQGKNDFQKINYGGPCPPSGTHRYFFKIYALDTKLEFSQAPTKKQLEQAMKNHVLDSAELMGTYARGLF